jgi:DNA-binding FadR family transcriptional regulator
MSRTLDNPLSTLPAVASERLADTHRTLREVAADVAAHLAAKRRTPGQLAEIRRCFDEGRAAVLIDRRGLLGWTEHSDILDAIEAGDDEAASVATRRHMSSVLDDLRRQSVDGVEEPAAPVRG